MDKQDIIDILDPDIYECSDCHKQFTKDKIDIFTDVCLCKLCIDAFVDIITD